MRRPIENSGLFDAVVVDLFAGLGGASIGIERGMVKAGFSRPIDVAINHNANAVACHLANHPHTRHLTADVFEVDPVTATGGKPVSLLWASPDCRHFSKAKGGKPVSKKVRSLAWVVVKWAKRVRPACIMLENVEEFQTWGPLDGDRPCPRRKGDTFRRWIRQLETLGYRVEWRELKACDYGAPTIRKRLYLIARCDGLPIVWPEKSHGPEVHKGRDRDSKVSRHVDQRSVRARSVSKLGAFKPYRTAAECIDWSLACPSIFLTREEAREVGCKRPLAAATLKRIHNGVWRYVINAARPFIVPIAHYNGSNTVQPIDEPLRTITAHPKGGSHAVVVPSLVGVGGRAGQSRPRGVDEPTATITSKGDTALVAPLVAPLTHQGERRCNPVDEPMPTVTGANRGEQSLVSAFLAKHYGGVVGTDMRKPVGTITARDHHSVAAASLMKLRGTSKDGQPCDEPMATITGGGTHIAEVRAFLCAYFGNDKDGQPMTDPMRTVTSKERFGLVMVNGEPHEIVDIGMRMLMPRELARAQGFPDEYRIDAGPNGRTLTKTEQVKLIGNSVCPDVAEAIVAANYSEPIRAVEVAS